MDTPAGGCAPCRHVVLKYTPEYRALVVLVGEDSSSPPFVARPNDMRFDDVILPVELSDAMKPIKLPADEVNLAALLTCGANLAFVDLCKHEVITKRDARYA